MKFLRMTGFVVAYGAMAAMGLSVAALFLYGDYPIFHRIFYVSPWGMIAGLGVAMAARQLGGVNKKNP